MKMKKTVIAGASLGALALAFTGISYATYRIAFYCSRKKEENVYELPKGDDYEKCGPVMNRLINELLTVPYEQVYIKSHDGLKLAARYYHVKDGAPLQIEIHGYRGTAIRDFCGGNKFAREMGHNTLLVDQRAHGKSEGHDISFGIKERYDCLQWINYARIRFGADVPIILSGVSMGATTVIMTNEFELPDNVVCVIADSPYSTPEAIIRKVCGDMKINHKLAYPFIKAGARMFAHFNLAEADALRAVKNAKIPILIIHGEADKFVPCDMSREIMEAAPGFVVRETFKEAGHGISYMCDSKRYEKISKEFIEKNLKRYKKGRP